MELITIIFVFIVLIILRAIASLDKETIEDIKETVNINQQYENSINDVEVLYSKMKNTDPEFKEKITKIHNLITIDKCEDIKEIAEKSNCTYEECIIKIKYLKHNKIITDYYVDNRHGYIKKCTEEEKKLINKLSPYIYSARLQPKEIAVRTYRSNEEDFEEHYEKIKEELKRLIDKDLLDGVAYNEVDDKLVYYINNKSPEKISITCKCCGAVKELIKGNKERCEYCNSIIDSDEIIKETILKK